MKLREIAWYGAVALGLALAGLVGTIGTLTLIFSPPVDSYVPKGSSDAAAWAQVVATLVGIIGAFQIGRQQGQQALKTAQQLQRDADQEEQRRYRQVVALMCTEAERLHSLAQANDYNTYLIIWEVQSQNSLNAVLQAFDAFPLHRLDSAARIVHAFNIRQCAGRIRDFAGRFLVGDGNENNYDHFRYLVQGQVDTLREQLREFNSTFPTDPESR